LYNIGTADGQCCNCKYCNYNCTIIATLVDQYCNCKYCNYNYTILELQLVNVATINNGTIIVQLL